MKTLTLTLDPILEQRLAAMAQFEHRSETEIILEAIAAYTSSELPDWVGIGASESGQLSETDEKILAAEWK
jgi:predicted transcriptional regulator